MYKLIYIYMLKLVEKRNPDPVFFAITFVWLSQLIHIAFIFAILKKVFNLTYPTFSDVYFYNKLFLTPFVILWLIIFNYYFKKRVKEIEHLYGERKVITLKNTIIVFSQLLMPLIIMIQLLKK